MSQTIKRTYTLGSTEAQELLSQLNTNPDFVKQKVYAEELSVCQDSFCHQIKNPNYGGRATLFHGGTQVVSGNIELLKTALLKALSQKASQKPVTCLSHVPNSKAEVLHEDKIKLDILVNNHNEVQSILAK